MNGNLNVPATICYNQGEEDVTKTYFSNSSCVIPDNEVWSMVSINETAPIYDNEFCVGGVTFEDAPS